MTMRQTASRGFTLIELLVTLAILAILLKVAVPSMVAFKKNAELTSAANTLLSAINAARGEAMKRGMNAMVVPTNNGTDWNTGWVVFVDKNRTQSYSGGVDATTLMQGTLPSYVSVSGSGPAAASPPYILFDASGFAKTKASGSGAATLTLTRTDLSGSTLYDQTRRIVIAATGRARVCKPTGASDATCAANSTQ